MPYFQNVFPVDFVGTLCLSDRQYSVSFKVPANKNTSFNMVNWVDGPYNLVGKTKFAIRFSLDDGLNYGLMSINLTSGTARTAQDIVTELNANSTFAGLFTASVVHDVRIRIVCNLATSQMKFKAYIPNIADTSTPSNSAEIALGFNLKAPVVELPSYFDRHTIANRATYSDSVGTLIKLTQTDENFVITNYGLSTTPKADYELMHGKSGLFMFTKNTVDGSNRVTTSIEYPAGAVAGDFARKTTYSYTSSNTNPDRIAQVPYTLTNSDLITPP